MTLTGGYVPELIDKKILARYRSPMVPFLRKGFVDPEGYWPGVYAIGYGDYLQHETGCRQRCPKRYEDLLGARWKDNMIMDLKPMICSPVSSIFGERQKPTFLRQSGRENKKSNFRDNPIPS